MAIQPLDNERTLLAQIAAGDERAFTELFDEYYKKLGAYVFELTQSLPVTEEIVQEVFIKLWLSRAQLPAIDHFTNYLFILCRNKTYDALRKIAAERLRQSNVEKVLGQEIELENLDDPTEGYRSLIEQAVGRLPAQQQKVFRLSRYERLKHDEIARELHISPETVKKHIQAAVSAIRKDLGTTTDLAIMVTILAAPLILHQ